MIKYVKLHSQFSDFVKSTTPSMVDPYERKLTNLILNNFDDIVEAGTAHGKRAALLSALITRFSKSIPDALPQLDHTSKSLGFPFKSLKKVEIGQFRGFTQKEDILFDKNYTFIYGPNGSGKSSFCEALEFSLLGYIDEAINKRIDINQYICNSFTGRAQRPKLLAIDHSGKEIEIQSASNLYAFCFIEKNRDRKSVV
jgi:DNA sulfur modification protein DndD